MSEVSHNNKTANFLSWMVLLAGILSLLITSNVINAAETTTSDFFVKINHQIISVEEYGNALKEGVRNRFYHASVPEGERESFEKEIGIKLIEDFLLDEQAKQWGLHADPSEVSKKLEYLDSKNQQYENWPTHRDEVLKNMKSHLEKASRLEQIERKIRDVPMPETRLTRAYYEKYPDKFTEPRRSRISLILLSAAASGGSSEWGRVKEQAEQLVFRARNGEPFQELAKNFSTDPSAEREGDMGYLHKGMLGEMAEKKIDELAIDEISDPVMLLEGWAIFKVTARQEAHLNTFDDVKERAAQLLKRDLSDAAWADFRKELINKANIEFSSRFRDQFKDI